jgi:RNA polymerase sigma-70 factor (ECF subfamily)
MERGMVQGAGTLNQPGSNLLDVYDVALPQVYGYLLRRCGSAPVAEDLTSETFMAAVDAATKDRMTTFSVAWLIGVARHKLVDHWRRVERQQRVFVVMDGSDTVDDWDEKLDAALAHETLAQLGAHHRSALTLRYLDGLSVPEVAAQLGRSVGATEVLLVRARRAFRARYESAGEEGDR